MRTKNTKSKERADQQTTAKSSPQVILTTGQVILTIRLRPQIIGSYRLRFGRFLHITNDRSFTTLPSLKRRPTCNLIVTSTTTTKHVINIAHTQL